MTKRIFKTKDFNSEDDKNKIVVIQAPIAAPVEDPEENRIHVVVRRMPWVPWWRGCYRINSSTETFLHPIIAQENWNTRACSSSAICVNTDGKIVDIEVVRGVRKFRQSCSCNKSNATMESRTTRR